MSNNMWSATPKRTTSMDRWRRAHGKRGVSPIIATILLVAITVVLAAVLYVLVSGLTRTGASTPYQLAMSETNSGGSGTTYTVTLALSPSAGLATGIFGLKIAQSGGATVPLSAPATNCKAWSTTPATVCTGVTAGDWYGVLIASNGTLAATYGSAGWTYYAGTTTITLNGGYTLWVVTTSAIAGSGDVISAFGTGTSSVSGSQYL
jgi:flagellin-like protein